MEPQPEIRSLDHKAYIQYALTLARRSPPKPTNFCVGAIMVDEVGNEIISTGYTLELPGNTHAEQCCLFKYKETTGDLKGNAGQCLVLYTTMEPCNKRASSNQSCVDRILETRSWGAECGVCKVYVGVQEPEKFVDANKGRKRLEDAGVEYVHVPGLEKEILEVATAGHQQ
ncbi:MAG: hypothetical protein Q9164_002557 [Protoblastenia rupestris]